MDKLALEVEQRRSSIPLWIVERRDSTSSTSSMSEKRSRKKRLPNDPETPIRDSKVAEMGFEIKRDLLKPQEDKFLDIFNKLHKDYADGRAIYRKMRNSMFFMENQQLLEEELDQEGTIYLCRNMHLKTCKENEVIFSKGDKNNGYIYLVYSGELEAQIPELSNFKQEFKQSNFFNEHNRRVSRDLSEIGTNKVMRASIVTQDSPFLSDSYGELSPTMRFLKAAAKPGSANFLGVPFRILRSGDYFGIEAVNNAENVREDTIYSRTESTLLMLKAQNLEYVKRRYQKDVVEKVNFLLQHISISQPNDLDLKNQLFNSMTERMLPLGEILILEGISSDYFYFLYQGKCEIQQRLKPEGPENISPKGKGNPPRNVGICLIEDGTFLGEEVLFNEDSCYNYTVKVISAKAIFFKFEKSDFNKHFKGEIVSGIKDKYLNKRTKHQEIYDRVSKQYTKRTNKSSLMQTFSPKAPASTRGSSSIFNFPVPRSDSADLLRNSSIPVSPTYSHTKGSSHALNNFDNTTPKGYLPAVNSPRNLTLRSNKSKEQIEKVVSSIKNPIDVLKEKMQTFYRQIPSKGDRICTEDDEISCMRSSRADFMTKSSNFENPTQEIGPSDAFDDSTKNLTSNMRKSHYRHQTEDFTSHIENCEDGLRDSTRKHKASNFMNNIENVKLNFGHETGRKHYHTPSHLQSKTFRTSMGGFTMGESKVVADLNGVKQTKDQDHDLKIASARNHHTVSLINSKIDLEALRTQFFDSPRQNMRDYLATYKKAQLQNKQTRNITDRLKLKDFEQRGHPKLKGLTNIFIKETSPPPVYSGNLLASPDKKPNLLKSPRNNVFEKQVSEMKSILPLKKGGSKIKLQKVPKIPIA